MTKIARILVPTDFSPVCDRALAHGAAIAARTGAELHVMHVQLLYRGIYGVATVPYVTNVEEALADQSRKCLDQAVAKVSMPVVHEVVSDLKEAPAIVRYAEARKIDLIVMGTHARKGVERLVLGSVAAGVLRESRVSAMLVGPECELRENRHHCVLAPVDFSESSVAALRQASAVAKQHDAELIALHVVESPIVVPYVGMAEPPVAIHERAARALDDWLHDANLSRPPTRRLVVTGKPDEEINAQARALDVDIIVMGTVGLSGLERLLLGSTTERVLRDAPCVVLAHRGAVLEGL